jgi:hypothetical protein
MGRRHSHPRRRGPLQGAFGAGLDDLKVTASLDLRKDGSLLFERTEHSWHGVRPLQSRNPGIYRKLFIVTVNLPSFQVWWRRVRGKDPDGYRYVQKPAA